MTLKMRQNQNLFIVLLLSANYYFTIKSEVLTIYENGLTASEKNHGLATALLAIEKTNNKNTIANSIVTEMTNKFGSNWYSLVTNVTNNESGSALNLQSNQLIRFAYETYEILIFKMSTVTTNSSKPFAQVLSEAKHATYKQNYLYDPDSKISDILTIVNNSLYRDYSSCHVEWVDVYGDCYGPMAVYIEETIYDKFSGKWSVTAGEQKSHFQAVTTPANTAQQVYAQFNYANLHFNVIHFNE